MADIARPSLRRVWCIVLVVVVILFCMTYLMSTRSTEPMLNSFSLGTSSRDSHMAQGVKYGLWPQFAVELTSPDAFKATCLSHVEKLSIATLSDMVADWKKAEDASCRELYEKFSAIYTVEQRLGSVKIPDNFITKVKGWLGNDNNLYQELFHQNIIHVMNRFTRETTVFNPLRDKRPVTKPKVSEEEYLKKIIEESAQNCDFCKFRNFTAEHTFGRVETDLSFSSSNIFKLDTLHAVVTIKEHNPISWSYDQFMDMMRLTMVWLDKAHKHEPRAIYPAIIWDLLPKSGSSQLHPHDQVFLSPNRYQGMVETWRMAAQDYYQTFKSNYFTDLVTLYSGLGLLARHKSAVAMASLTPRKDNEVVIIAEKAGDDFFELIYYVLRAFMDDLKKYSFSLGGGFPAMSEEARAGKIPAFVRIITRGVMTEIRTDISALELFTATNVNIDPYKVIGVVSESLRKRVPRL